MKKGKVILGSAIALVLVILVVVTSVVAKTYDEQITYWWSGTFTDAELSVEYTADEALENGRQVSMEQAAEGVVLLENKNGALPLSESERNVSLIGYASHNPVYCGAGSVSWNTTGDRSDFYDAFEYYDFTINPSLREYYTKNFGDRDTKEGQAEMTGGDFTIYDREISDYENLLVEGGKSGDVAIVTLARMGGENNDLPMDMGDETLLGSVSLSDHKTSYGDAGKSYLELQQVEIDMLKAARENYSKVIVLLNTCNAMECGPLEEYADAVLWIGQPGGRGTYSVVSCLIGETNPSGKMVDTYAYEHESSPTFYTSLAGTYENFDEFASVTNNVNGVEYTIDNKVDGAINYYYENIYVGYKWYETADAEGFWDTVSNEYGDGYEGVVQWPFGYGLSYTDFDWEVTKTDLGDIHGQISIEVKVTNKGSVAGKDVVELYFASPYTEYDKENGIEKAAKSLCAFAKTDLLEPGKSETVTLKLDVDELASYDAKGNGCYLLEAGDYMLYVSTDSHNVKEGIEPIVYKVAADAVYNDDGVGKRSSDLVVAENQFDIAYTDGNIGTEEKPYLSRKDFENTNPNTFLGNYIRKLVINMSPEMVEYMITSVGGSDVDLTAGDTYKDPDFVFASDQEKGIMIDDMKGIAYDDAKWDEFVAQLSIDEMIGTLKEGFTGTLAIDKVGVTATANTEGPSGVSSLNSNKAGNQYAAEPVTAATWNVELAAKIGSAIGKEAVTGGFASINGPAMNTHRTPYGGRNGEYYSEDGFLAGKIGASQVKAQQGEGVYCLIKHFALNETDNGRGGMYTWTTEQAIREIYLRPFEYSVKEGGASGVMASYNRIGPMETCTCRGLNNQILRNEWGFIGTVATDGYSKDMTGKYMIVDNQIFAGAGTLLFIGDWSIENTGLSANILESDYGKEMLFKNAKNFLYRYVNAEGAAGTTLDLTRYWLIPLIALCVLLLAAAVLVTFKITIPGIKGTESKKKAKKGTA
ncbi:MAG: glycoside hydrolase family 3 protein [Parasporobacterium sp.]|nr:glycoside hydrolase family 3 protein [Parasporobacterium sp.]